MLSSVVEVLTPPELSTVTSSLATGSSSSTSPSNSAVPSVSVPPASMPYGGVTPGPRISMPETAALSTEAMAAIRSVPSPTGTSSTVIVSGAFAPTSA
jgi:hypothetical protein